MSDELHEEETFSVTITVGEDYTKEYGPFPSSKAERFTLPSEDPTESGKELTSWIDEEGNSYKLGEEVEISSSKTFRAIFAEDIFTGEGKTKVNVTIDEGFEEGTISSIEHEEGDVISISDIVLPSRTEYTFLGWFINDEKIESDSITIGNEDITILAKWKQNLRKYNIYFYNNANGASAEIAKFEVEEGTLLNDFFVDNEVPKFIREDYELIGFNSQQNGSGMNYTDYRVTSDMTFYAQWKRVVIIPEYTITFHKNDGIHFGNEEETTFVIVPENSYIFGVPSFVNGSYILSEWNTKADGTGETVDNTYKVTKPLDVYAIWKTKEVVDDENDAKSNKYKNITAINAPIKPAYRTDRFPVADINYLKGGLHVAAFEDDLFNLNDENKLLTSSRLKIGMEVYCLDTGRKFRLIGGTYECNKAECGCTLTQGICNEEFKGCSGLAIKNPDWNQVFELLYLDNTETKKAKTLYDVESNDPGNIVINKAYVDNMLFDHKHDGIKARKISFFDLYDIDAIDAFTLGGRKSSWFAPSNHVHPQYALYNHSHPDWLDFAYVQKWANGIFAFKEHSHNIKDWTNEFNDITNAINEINLYLTGKVKNYDFIKLYDKMLDNGKLLSIDGTTSTTGVSEYAARADHAHDYATKARVNSIANTLKEHIENHVDIKKDDLIKLETATEKPNTGDFGDKVKQGDKARAARADHYHEKLDWIEKIVFGENTSYTFNANLNEKGVPSGKVLYSLYALRLLFDNLSETNVDAHIVNSLIHLDNENDLKNGKITKQYIIDNIGKGGGGTSNLQLGTSGDEFGTSEFAARFDHTHDSRYLGYSYGQRVEALEEKYKSLVLGAGGDGATLINTLYTIPYDAPNRSRNTTAKRIIIDVVEAGDSPFAARANHYHTKLDYIDMMLDGDTSGNFEMFERAVNKAYTYYSIYKLTQKAKNSEKVEKLIGMGKIKDQSDENLDKINHEDRIKSLEDSIKTLLSQIDSLKKSDHAYEVGQLKFVAKSKLSVIDEESDTFDGWTYPDGRSLRISMFPELFKEIGITDRLDYNNFVDPSKAYIDVNTFKLPDLRNFARLNPGLYKTESMKFNAYHNALPVHSHTFTIDSAGAHAHHFRLAVGDCGCGSNANNSARSTHFSGGEIGQMSSGGTHTHTGTIANTGKNEESYPNHNLLPVLMYIGKENKIAVSANDLLIEDNYVRVVKYMVREFLAIKDIAGVSSVIPAENIIYLTTPSNFIYMYLSGSTLKKRTVAELYNTMKTKFLDIYQANLSKFTAQDKQEIDFRLSFLKSMTLVNKDSEILAHMNMMDYISSGSCNFLFNPNTDTIKSANGFNPDKFLYHDVLDYAMTGSRNYFGSNIRLTYKRGISLGFYDFVNHCYNIYDNGSGNTDLVRGANTHINILHSRIINCIRTSSSSDSSAYNSAISNLRSYIAWSIYSVDGNHGKKLSLMTLINKLVYSMQDSYWSESGLGDQVLYDVASSETYLGTMTTATLTNVKEFDIDKTSGTLGISSSKTATTISSYTFGKHALINYFMKSWTDSNTFTVCDESIKYTFGAILLNAHTPASYTTTQKESFLIIRGHLLQILRNYYYTNDSNYNKKNTIIKPFALKASNFSYRCLASYCVNKTRSHFGTSIVYDDTVLDKAILNLSAVSESAASYVPSKTYTVNEMPSRVWLEEWIIRVNKTYGWDISTEFYNNFAPNPSPSFEWNLSGNLTKEFYALSVNHGNGYGELYNKEITFLKDIHSLEANASISLDSMYLYGIRNYLPLEKSYSTYNSGYRNKISVSFDDLLRHNNNYKGFLATGGDDDHLKTVIKGVFDSCDYTNNYNQPKFLIDNYNDGTVSMKTMWKEYYRYRTFLSSTFIGFLNNLKEIITTETSKNISVLAKDVIATTKSVFLSYRNTLLDLIVNEGPVYLLSSIRAVNYSLNTSSNPPSKATNNNCQILYAGNGKVTINKKSVATINPSSYSLLKMLFKVTYIREDSAYDIVEKASNEVDLTVGGKAIRFASTWVETDNITFATLFGVSNTTKLSAITTTIDNLIKGINNMEVLLRRNCLMKDNLRPLFADYVGEAIPLNYYFNYFKYVISGILNGTLTFAEYKAAREEIIRVYSMKQYTLGAWLGHEYILGKASTAYRILSMAGATTSLNASSLAVYLGFKGSGLENNGIWSKVSGLSNTDVVSVPRLLGNPSSNTTGVSINLVGTTNTSLTVNNMKTYLTNIDKHIDKCKNYFTFTTSENASYYNKGRYVDWITVMWRTCYEIYTRYNNKAFGF